MAGGLLGLLGLGGQQPMQAQTAGQPQSRGLLSNISDPLVALPLAGALMQPGGFGQNLGQGFAMAGQGLQVRNKLQEDKLQQNATAKFLEAQGADPAIVELAKSGAGAMALQQWNAMKPEKVDPLDALRAKKLDLEIGALSTPQESDYQRRVREAEQAGLKPDDPAYQSYTLTGKMPREDQAPLTSTDKQAILSADDQVATNTNAIDTIDQALAVNSKANSGAGAGTRAFLGNNLPDLLVPDSVSSPESSAATVEYDNLVQNQALQQLKSIFGGNPTEGERAILLELQASSNKKPEVRQKILERARTLAERRLQFNKERAAQLRGGTFYKQGGGAVQPANPGTVVQAPATSTGVTWSVEP